MNVRRGIIVFALIVAATGCAKSPETQRSQATASATKSLKELVFLTRAGCVNTTTMRANLDEALKALGLPSDYQFIDSDTLTDSDVRTGYPTPTLLYDNHDLFGMPEPAASHPPAT